MVSDLSRQENRESQPLRKPFARIALVATLIGIILFIIGVVFRSDQSDKTPDSVHSRRLLRQFYDAATQYTSDYGRWPSHLDPESEYFELLRSCWVETGAKPEEFDQLMASTQFTYVSGNAFSLASNKVIAAFEVHEPRSVVYLLMGDGRVDWHQVPGLSRRFKRSSTKGLSGCIMSTEGLLFANEAVFKKWTTTHSQDSDSYIRSEFVGDHKFPRRIHLKDETIEFEFSGERISYSYVQRIDKTIIEILYTDAYGVVGAVDRREVE